MKDIINRQRAFFEAGISQDIKVRIQKLKTLYQAIQTYETRIHEAIEKDLGKSAFESYMCETGLVLHEITHMLKHIHRYAHDKTVVTPLAQFASHSYVKACPYGVVLIMSPWNYPFLLSIGPLVDALAAGNTCVLKLSEYSPNTSAIIKEMIESIFSKEYVCVFDGDVEQAQALLQEHFDYIFFTGSTRVGKEVMKEASCHLTPVTLELGGKSPCIVDEKANIALSAKRIVFGKFLNSGQTCVAPDYIYVHESVKDALIEAMKKEIEKQYISYENYGKIVNQKHFERLVQMINPDKVVFGGTYDQAKMQIYPTLMDKITYEDKVMEEEIFGPILPILTYQNIDTVIATINANHHPLALYIFTDDKIIAKKVMQRCIFGGGCINDCIIHLASTNMGFGGVGDSGMGSYHGKKGFDTFTHYKSIVDKKTWIDLPMRYQPYRPFYEKIVRFFLK